MVTARSPYRQMKGNMTIMTALHAVPSEAIASDLSDDPDLTEEASSPDEAEVERGTIDYREAFGVGSAFEADLQRALLNRPEPPEIIMLEVHNGCVTYGVLVLEGDEYRQAEIHRKMHKYVWEYLQLSPPDAPDPRSTGCRTIHQSDLGRTIDPRLTLHLATVPGALPRWDAGRGHSLF